MCSELTPRAPIPDTRIPQLMQPWPLHSPTFLVIHLVHVNRGGKRDHTFLLHIHGQRFPHVVCVFVIVSTVILKNGPVDSVAKLVVEVDGDLVAHPDEEVDKVAVLAVRDLLKSFHQAIGKTKSAVLWPDSHCCNMAMPVLVEPLRLAHDVTHQVACRGLRHLKVLGPSSHVLEVETEAVHLCEGVEINAIEPEEVITGELA